MDIEMIILLSTLAVIVVVGVKVAWLLKVTKKSDTDPEQEG